MAITKPIEYSETPGLILQKMADRAREQQLLDLKLRRENEQNQLDILQQINPATLYSKFEKEVADSMVSEIQNATYAILKKNPNISAVDLQRFVNESLSRASQLSSNIKLAKENIDKSISLIDNNSVFNKGAMRALAIDRAIYKTVDGRKVLKSPEEIDASQDYVSMIANDNVVMPSIIDAFKAEQSMRDMVKNTATVKKTVLKTKKLPSGFEKTEESEEVLSPDFSVVGGRVVAKRGENGYVSEDVYGKYYLSPAGRFTIESNALKNMRALGVQETPENLEYYKRAYLTTFLDNNATGIVGEKVIEKYKEYEESERQRNYVDAYNEIDQLASSKPTGKGAPLIELPIETQNVVIDIAKNALGSDKIGQADVYIKKEKDGSVGVYTGRPILDDDNNVLRPFGSKVGTLTRTGTNIAANKSFGQPVKNTLLKEGQSASQMSIKRSEIDSQAASSGYTTAEYIKLLQKNGIKIIE